MGRTKNGWIPVTVDTPVEGTPIAVLNGVKCWLTIWRDGLTHHYGKHPVTHYTLDLLNFHKFPRPYKARDIDRTGMPLRIEVRKQEHSVLKPSTVRRQRKIDRERRLST